MKKNILFFLGVMLATIVVALVVGRAVVYLDERDAFSEAKNKPLAQNTEANTEAVTEATTEYIPKISNAKLLFTGDLMVHQWQMDDARKRGNGEYSFEHSFKEVAGYIQAADLAVGNLETVFAGEEIGYSDYPCFNTPDTFLAAIKAAGFDVLTTANNHSVDKGVKGVYRTIDVLDNAGIGHFGTYKSQEERDKVFIKEVNGIRIAFVSATYGVNGNYIPDDQSYAVNILSEELIKRDIEAARAENPDMVIVMPHIGNEYESAPKEVFVNWIDNMIKYGADIVIASHPHVLQPMELREVELEDGSIRKGFVTYSMANFISSQRDKPRDTGVMVNISLKKTDNERAVIEEISFIPTWVQWRDTTGSYNIRVLSIYDALSDINNGGNKYGLRGQDIKRLKEAQEESITTITGKPSEEIQPLYYIMKKD